MKKLICILAGVLLWASPLMAETYSWIDESGTYNFTEDYSRVPQKYRSNLDKRGDMGAAPQPKESVPPQTGSKVAAPEDSKDSPAGKSLSPVGTFGGKSYDQWRQEFSDREAAMDATKKRIDEMDAVLSKNPPNKEQSQTFLSERNKAVEKFNEMRKQYDQFAEQARKAGIQVNISR
jgi:hypothetical protein